jgi:hypothetical protein
MRTAAAATSIGSNCSLSSSSMACTASAGVSAVSCSTRVALVRSRRAARRSAAVGTGANSMGRPVSRSTARSAYTLDGGTSVIATPSRPARPIRPMRCT